MLVSVDGNEYWIYGTLADAIAYNKMSLLPGALLWEAGDDDFKLKYQINAAKLIDRIAWAPEASTQDLRDALEDFRKASYEMAIMLINNPAFFTQETSGSNIKRASIDGGPAITFFNQTLGITGRFPTNIMELLGKYLGGKSSSSNSFSSGTDGTHKSIDESTPESAAPYGVRTGLL